MSLTSETHTLKGMMDLNGHKFVDLLKVDVEGSEMEVLKEIIKTANGRPLPFGQLLLEIHAWNGDFRTWIEWYDPISSLLDLNLIIIIRWELLEGAGLRPHYRELNYQDALYFGSPKVIEYSFSSCYFCFLLCRQLIRWLLRNSQHPRQPRTGQRVRY